MVWPYFKVFRSSKDTPKGHNEMKKKKGADKRRGRKTISKSGQEWTLPAQLGQLKNRIRRKGIIANSSVVPVDLPRLLDRIK